jgi:hypothetical protein
MRDGSSRKKRQKRQGELREHSTRYDRYKADLDRLFDQGLAGELIKKVDAPNSPGDPSSSATTSKGKVLRRKSNGRIPKTKQSNATSRFKLMRTIVDVQDQQTLLESINKLVESFGMPDDWDVLIRILEHPKETLVYQAISKMSDLFPVTPKIPRRASLKERLRSIGQTALDSNLRDMASKLGVLLQ